MPADTVLLIRHGETDFNREHRLQGLMGVPLNATGRSQAMALAQYLSDRSIDALYASPISRAKVTAEIIADALRLPLIEDPRLRELSYGVFEGLTRTEQEARYPAELRDWTAGYLEYRVPGGESRIEVSRRMRQAWDEIVSREHQTVALVSHGSAIKIFLGSLYALLPDAPLRNTSITTLKRRGTIWQIAGFAETPHLR